MMASGTGSIFLYPFRAALELLRALLRPAYKGAPSSWTLEMTAIVVLLPFIILVLHLWDADIVRVTAQSTNFIMEFLRAVTDAIRTIVWLAIGIVVWLVTAILLSPKLRDSARPWFVKLHSWATLVLTSIVVGSIPTEIGKLAIGRARPFLLDDVGAAYFSPFKGQFLYESFPSGHSMMAGIMMVSLWIFLPRWRVLTAPACFLFGISRLAAGAHYPTDIVAGLTIGFVATWWVARYMATRNIIFSLDGESAMPRV
ncbi:MULTISPECIES: lipid A 1-phosphatase LpxE [Brucella/Ochrobactrum group]|uniref:PAP2 superfamily protein n=1 Tax=Brucella lupini TaxID=255457 RepID=A0A256GMJ3_9HYPH|nr:MULTISPECIES: lipid A 1-phosphatase LpxE [Brucella/Ochrobactrum group]AIK44975.1 PAP2 superfamily protein [Brucella anthropi]KAB2702236.1 phosphatase PAP2 family protein [Brucella lupini]KAB2727907.1 phosphatase PAP2 family protein [Brucella anthropi]KAB2745078.1 phosphatase PAP2 family protein [Brucella anthropi]KAB2746589.1 phosphatase PAP2 family protein [Brucella anthropi]